MKKKLAVFIALFCVVMSVFMCACDGRLKEEKINIPNFSLKDWAGSDSSRSYDITAEKLDFEELDEKGYCIKIELTFDVYYKKDYALSIGYAGAPKYKISVNQPGSLYGFFEKDLPTTTTLTTKKFSWTQTADFFENKDMELTFSTDNIQNIIYFENINLTYRCINALELLED